MTDRFRNHASGMDSPASHGFVVTPHDTNDLPETTRALYVGGAGNIALILASGQALTFSNVPAGAFLPIRVSAVKSTGTNATQILGLL